MRNLHSINSTAADNFLISGLIEHESTAKSPLVLHFINSNSVILGGKRKSINLGFTEHILSATKGLRNSAPKTINI